VVIVYRDCDFGFVDGVLDFIAPHGGGRTIDGLTAGAPISRAAELYGPAVSAAQNSDGTHSVIFSADQSSDAGYRILVDQFGDTGGTLSGLVKTIVLCRCAPKPGAATGPGPAIIVIKAADAQGSTQPGFTKDSRRRDDPIDCSYGDPSPYDVTSGVRFCGTTADGGDACWATAGGAYVLCLTDPLSPSLKLISAEGATTALRPRTTDPVPMVLILDNGTKCRARIGGSWPGRTDVEAAETFWRCGRCQARRPTASRAGRRDGRSKSAATQGHRSPIPSRPPITWGWHENSRASTRRGRKCSGGLRRQRRTTGFQSSRWRPADRRRDWDRRPARSGTPLGRSVRWRAGGLHHRGSR
jgi:hypothetical protein